jgi:hypothetical protein
VIPAEAAQMEIGLKPQREWLVPKRTETLSDYLLKGAVNESKRRSTVQLAEEFARTTNTTPAGAVPPLTDLLWMGEVPLRLYLTLVMMTAKAAEQGAARPLHRETAPSHFAEMLGYDNLADGVNPPGAGTRRVQRAMEALRDKGFIELRKEPGHYPWIAVVHPGDGGDLTPPYITIPIEIWKNGWITALSARAFTVYIALRLVTIGKKQGQGQHLPPYERDKFQLSPDTWQRGTKELAAKGLLEVSPGIVETRGLRSRHRNVYYMNLDRVRQERPTDPPSPIQPLETQ